MTQTPESGDKEKLAEIVHSISNLRKEVDILLIDRTFNRTLLTSILKRLDALEHPCMDEPLKQFQKLRVALQKVDEACI